METATASFTELAVTSRTLARRLLTMGENRLELLTVEMQEERECLLQAILMALGVAAFGLGNSFRAGKTRTPGAG